MFILKIYSFIQSKLGFSSFGANSIVKFPYKIWGKKNIKIGKNVFIAENSFLCAVTDWNGQKFTPKLTIGNNVTIGSNFFVTTIEEIEIENNVLISDRVFISDHIHDYEDVKTPIMDQPLKKRGKVIIKDGSFIGINSVIMPGVTIGKNSVIGASSIIIEDVPDFSVVTGNPAKIIKKYSLKEKKWIRIK